MNDTTPSSDSGDTNTTQENWEARYAGLQKVLAKRDTDLRTATEALDGLKGEHEAAQNELAAFRQRDVDASEDEAARQQYEALRQRFEPEAPTPVGNNPARPARGWEDGSDDSWNSRERAGTGSGWPT